MKDLGKLLVSVLAFTFTAFFFPTLQEACSGASGGLAPVLQVFPTILLVFTGVLVAWNVFEELD